VKSGNEVVTTFTWINGISIDCFADVQRNCSTKSSFV